MSDKLLFVAIVLIAVSLADTTLVPFIKKCESNDSKCAQASAAATVPIFAAGLPNLGVKTVDPLHFDKVDASAPNVKFILSNITLEDLKDCEITKLERNKPTTKINLKLQCSPKLRGQYELTGSLLILTVAGKGNIFVQLRKAIFDLELEIVTKTGADGKKHWHIKRFHHKYELPNKSDVVFENLFEGNDILSQAADDLIKNSGSEIVKEIGGPMVVQTIIDAVKEINHLFGAVPIEDLSID